MKNKWRRDRKKWMSNHHPAESFSINRDIIWFDCHLEWLKAYNYFFALYGVCYEIMIIPLFGKENSKSKKVKWATLLSQAFTWGAHYLFVFFFWVEHYLFVSG